MALTLRRGTKPTGDPADLSVDLYTWPDPSRPAAVLVPPTVLAERRLRRTTRYTALVAAAVTAAVALGCAGSWYAAGAAADDLAAAQSEAAAANARVARYFPVANYYDGLLAQRVALTDQLEDDVTYAGLSDLIFDARPDGLTLASVEVTPGTSCPGPNPFQTHLALGCVQLAGTGSVEKVSAFVENLNAVGPANGLSDAFASSLNQSQGELAYAISVNYTPALYSGRYTLETDTADTAAGHTDSGAAAAAVDGPQPAAAPTLPGGTP